MTERMKKSKNVLSKDLFSRDEDFYIYLFREYYVALCAYSRKFVGRKDVAEEIVSETFMKIWENRSSLIINTSVKAYLFGAVYNNSLNYLRTLKEELRLEEYTGDASFDNLGVNELDKQEEDFKMADDFHLKIEKAVKDLPTQQQKVFRMKRYEGKKNKEIADILGISIKTVEMHLAKATLNLREALKNHLPAFLLFMLLR